MKETWKTIEKSRGQYEVSDWGRVRNKRTNRILKPSGKRAMVHLSGYIGKTVLISNLVAREFIGEGRVFHRDGDPRNNHKENLEVK